MTSATTVSRPTKPKADWALSTRTGGSTSTRPIAGPTPRSWMHFPPDQCRLATLEAYRRLRDIVAGLIYVNPFDMPDGPLARGIHAELRDLSPHLKSVQAPVSLRGRAAILLPASRQRPEPLKTLSIDRVKMHTKPGRLFDDDRGWVGHRWNVERETLKLACCAPDRRGTRSGRAHVGRTLGIERATAWIRCRSRTLVRRSAPAAL